jgi:hypothetical protein
MRSRRSASTRRSCGPSATASDAVHRRELRGRLRTGLSVRLTSLELHAALPP